VVVDKFEFWPALAVQRLRRTSNQGTLDPILHESYGLSSAAWYTSVIPAN